MKRLMYVATKASQSKMFSFGVSSSFSLASNARKFVTPGHLEGDVVMHTPSSVEYRR